MVSNPTIWFLPVTLLHITVLQNIQGMSLDQIIVESENVSAPADVFFDDNSNFFKVELDIAVTFDEYDEMEKAKKEEKQGNRKKRTTAMKVRKWGGKRWTNNVVYYQILSHFTGKEVGSILDAIEEWKKHTCLTFIQSNVAENRIQFKQGRGGCYSRLGMVGGPQDVGLGRYCPNKLIVLHEVGHALGLFHEQTRPDRDNYVTILRNNVNDKMASNFDINTWESVDNLGIPYDYRSIMHYGKTAFTVNGRDTIRTTDPAYQEVIGRGKGLSFGDIKTMNIMYNCKKHTPSCNLEDRQCPGSGFVGKDCTCVCAGPGTDQPTKQCPGTVKPKPKPKPTEPPSIVCEDKNTKCSKWASQGECDKNMVWMHPNCVKSCGLCNYGSCIDKNIKCARWASQGECDKNSWMKKNCKKSCRVCIPETTTTTTTTTTRAPPTGSCKDEHYACEKWGRTGFCTGRYKETIRPLCKKSCGICGCEDKHEACQKWGRTGFCTGRYKETIQPLCRLSCGLC